MMVNREQKRYTLRRSQALIASVLLHGIVLAGLVAIPRGGPTPEPGVMITYLAMPAMVPERVPHATAGPVQKNVHEPIKAKSVKQVQPQLLKAVHQVPAKTPVMVKKTITNPGAKLMVDGVVEDTLVSAKLDLEGLTAKEAAEDNTSEDTGIKSSNDEITIQSPQNLVVNSQSSILNSQLAILAFAGNPASLGMIVGDTLGPDLVEAAILSMPEPAYPVLSRRRGEEGRVVLEVTISAQGAVRRAQIKASSLYPRLDKAALKAIQRATFSPATEYGRPVESVTKVAYRFELRK